MKELISWTSLKLKTENIAKDTYDEGLLSKIYKELLKFNNKKKNTMKINGPKALTPHERS